MSVCILPNLFIKSTLLLVEFGFVTTNTNWVTWGLNVESPQKLDVMKELQRQLNLQPHFLLGW